MMSKRRKTQNRDKESHVGQGYPNLGSIIRNPKSWIILAVWTFLIIGAEEAVRQYVVGWFEEPEEPRITIDGFLPVFVWIPDQGDYRRRGENAPRMCEFPMFSFNGIIKMSNRSNFKSYFNQVTVDGEVTDTFDVMFDGKEKMTMSLKYHPQKPSASLFVKEGVAKTFYAYLYLISQSLPEERSLLDTFETEYFKIKLTDFTPTCLQDIRLGASYTRSPLGQGQVIIGSSEAPADGHEDSIVYYYLDRAPASILGRLSPGKDIFELVPAFYDGAVRVIASIGTYNLLVKPETILKPVMLGADEWDKVNDRELFEKRFLYSRSKP